MPTILLIDDSPKIGALLSQIPRVYADWQLLIATDGPRGIELFREHLPRIDAILLDVLMPGMDGYWTCFMLRKLSTTVAIIPYTGTACDEELFAQFGCAAPIIKPVTLDQLLHKVRAAIVEAATGRLMEHSPLVRFVQDHAATLEEQVALNNERSTLFATERQLVPGVTLDDLDLHQVAQHLAFATRYRGYDGPTTPLDFLQHDGFLTDLAGEVAPTFAGVLAFTPTPERWIGACGIDIVQFTSPQPSTQAIAFQHQVRGPLLDLLDRTIAILWTRIQHIYRIETTERIEEHEYPMAVLRELTVNALAHRDWSYVGARVRIQLFPDRIEWISPGGLPPGVTPETMRQAQVSRNPVLVRFLYLAGKVESFGMGIDTVEDTLRDYGCRPLQVVENTHLLTMCVWSRLFDHPSTDTAFTERQQRILAALRRHGDLTSTQLSALLNEAPRNIQRDLVELVKQGVLTAVGATHQRRYVLKT